VHSEDQLTRDKQRAEQRRINSIRDDIQIANLILRVRKSKTALMFPCCTLEQPSGVPVCHGGPSLQLPPHRLRKDQTRVHWGVCPVKCKFCSTKCLSTSSQS
jgi:hypothetical protein